MSVLLKKMVGSGMQVDAEAYDMSISVSPLWPRGAHLVAHHNKLSVVERSHILYETGRIQVSRKKGNTISGSLFRLMLFFPISSSTLVASAVRPTKLGLSFILAQTSHEAWRGGFILQYLILERETRGECRERFRVLSIDTSDSDGG